jgi:hypothetical protein
MYDGSFGDFVRGIDFELIRPDIRRGSDGRFTIERAQGSKATLLELPGIPIDTLNTRFGTERLDFHRALRPVCDMPRMESFAIGAIVNRGVAALSPDEAYVNVGVWNGFSLLSGVYRNPDKRCIGIDNFSQLGTPRTAFMTRFEERKGPAHEFFEMDYEEYFSVRHDIPIGLYFYDGDHAYEHQLRGLQIAEPFFAEDCVVLVDDTNWSEPYEATFDFIAQSERDYEVLLDVRTAGGRHPTWWNGLVVLRATGRPRKGNPPAPSRRPRLGTALGPNPVDFASRSTLVSLIVCNPEDAGSELEQTVDLAHRQTWPAVEVIVASESVRAAFEASNGSFVALVDSREAALDERSVECALALPGLSRFDLGPVEGARAQLLRGAFEAPADVDRVLPSTASFVLASRTDSTSAMIDTERAVPLFAEGTRMRELDGGAAIARLRELRGAGARFAVFPISSFGWLAAHPEVEDHLRTAARPLLENDRVRIFEL